MKTKNNESKAVTITLSKEAIEKGKKDANNNARSFSKHIQWLLMTVKICVLGLFISCAGNSEKNSIPNELTYFHDDNLPTATISVIYPSELPEIHYDTKKEITYELGFFNDSLWVPYSDNIFSNNNIDYQHAYVLRIYYDNEAVLTYVTASFTDMMNNIEAKVKESEAIINARRIAEMQKKKTIRTINDNIKALNDELSKF